MRPRRARPSSQAGMGLVFVLGLGLLVMGMGALAHQLLNSTVNGSSRHVSREQALHIAEQGIDASVARLATDAAWNTDARFGALPPGATTLAAEEAWVRAQLATVADGDPAVQAVPGGEIVVVKPSNGPVVYAGGWVPSRAAATSMRLLRTQYSADTSAEVTHAILTAGDLNISGNPAITGVGAGVHSNADGAITGSVSVEGSLTVSGKFTSLKGTFGGGTAAGVPPVAIPAVDPRDLWNRYAASTLYIDNWYDLCPDGTVRRPDGSAPCDGTPLLDTSAGEFRGWRLSGGVWETSNKSAYDGVYYAYGRSIRVGGNAGKAAPWRATLIAEDRVTGTAADGCAIRADGDIRMTGTPSLTPLLESITLVAGRDLDMAGNAKTGDQGFSGLITAREQFNLTGNPAVNGAIVAQTACNTTGSPVAANDVKGSVTVAYDGSLQVATDEGVRSVLWSEL